MPLPTSNPGALITTVGGIPGCRIALYVNSIAALQVRTAARQGEWWWETRARSSMSSRSNKVKDGRLVVVPPLFRAFWREFPDLTSRSYIGPPHWRKCSQPRWLEQREAQRPRSWPGVLSTYGAEVRQSTAHDLESKDFRGPVVISMRK